MPNNLFYKRLELFPISTQVISRNGIQKRQALDDMLRRDLPLPGVQA